MDPNSAVSAAYVLAPLKPQSPPPRPRLALGRLRPPNVVRQPDTITAKPLARGRTQPAVRTALLGLLPKLFAPTRNKPFAGPSRERYIVRLLDKDPAMAQVFLGVVQTAWPLLDNTARAKILTLATTDKFHAWARVHHPETQP